MKVYISKYPRDPNKKRKVEVRIDKWDTWNMDETLAHIILPMLKQLKETKNGAPYVDLKDVPEHLRSVEKDEYGTDVQHFDRWEYVLNEMIFAFESKLTDWEDQFWKVKPEIDFDTYLKNKEKDTPTQLQWKVEGVCDWDGVKAYRERIANGFRLFGTYYDGLWD